MPKRPITVKLKSELLCRKCGAAWKYTGDTISTSCPYCGAFKDARDRTGYKSPNHNQRKGNLIDWYSERENRLARGAKHRALLRKRVFFRICNSIIPSCVRCGCNDPRFLEINHKNGGGAREVRKANSRSNASNRFYYDIASGVRSTDDLELLCKPCNAIHALEMRFGPLPMHVIWSGYSKD